MPKETGFAAYRATVNVDKITADPEIMWLVQQPSLNIWYVSSASSKPCIDSSQDWSRPARHDIHHFFWQDVQLGSVACGQVRPR